MKVIIMLRYHTCNRIVVDPKLLQIGQLANASGQISKLVPTEVQACQESHLKHPLGDAKQIKMTQLYSCRHVSCAEAFEHLRPVVGE